MPSNNCSDYKDRKRLQQQSLSYPFTLARGPAFHMHLCLLLWQQSKFEQSNAKK